MAGWTFPGGREQLPWSGSRTLSLSQSTVAVQCRRASAVSAAPRDATHVLLLRPPLPDDSLASTTSYTPAFCMTNARLKKTDSKL